MATPVDAGRPDVTQVVTPLEGSATSLPGTSDSATDVGQRIKESRERLGWSQDRLARESGLSKGAIYNYETGQPPKSSQLLAICKALDASPAYILLGVGPVRASELANLESQVGRLSQDLLAAARRDRGPADIPPTGPQDQRLPSLAEPQRGYLSDPSGSPVLSKGNSVSGFTYIPIIIPRVTKDLGFIFNDIIKPIHHYLHFSNEWLGSICQDKAKIALMYLEGNSMFPTANHGDLVLIDSGRQDIRDGQIYALAIGGTVVVKRLMPLVGGRVRMISDNRAEYPPEEAQSDDVQVVGQVIWLGRELVRR